MTPRQYLEERLRGLAEGVRPVLEQQLDCLRDCRLRHSAGLLNKLLESLMPAGMRSVAVDRNSLEGYF